MNYENDLTTATILTDLSAAFDTIDTSKLLEKLNFYGIQGIELDIIASFMTDRTQFVTIDNFKSKTLASLECSVIQGSKLSAMLYTIYTNEITLLHTLMTDDIYEDMTGRTKIDFFDTKHTIVNYVDDSTNIVSSDNITKLQTYINNYYLLLEAYYNSNFLKINASKSNLMITCKPRFRFLAKNIVLQASNYTIQQSTKI